MKKENSIKTELGLVFGFFSVLLLLPFIVSLRLYVQLLDIILSLYAPYFVLFLGFAFGVVGLIISIISFRKDRSNVAKIGIIVNSIGLLLALILFSFMLLFLAALSR